MLRRIAKLIRGAFSSTPTPKDDTNEDWTTATPEYYDDDDDTEEQEQEREQEPYEERIRAIQRTIRNYLDTMTVDDYVFIDRLLSLFVPGNNNALAEMYRTISRLEPGELVLSDFLVFHHGLLRAFCAREKINTQRTVIEAHQQKAEHDLSKTVCEMIADRERRPVKRPAEVTVVQLRKLVDQLTQEEQEEQEEQEKKQEQEQEGKQEQTEHQQQVLEQSKQEQEQEQHKQTNKPQHCFLNCEAENSTQPQKNKKGAD